MKQYYHCPIFAWNCPYFLPYGRMELQGQHKLCMNENPVKNCETFKQCCKDTESEEYTSEEEQKIINNYRPFDKTCSTLPDTYIKDWDMAWEKFLDKTIDEFSTIKKGGN